MCLNKMLCKFYNCICHPFYFSKYVFAIKWCHVIICFCHLNNLFFRLNCSFKNNCHVPLILNHWLFIRVRRQVSFFCERNVKRNVKRKYIYIYVYFSAVLSPRSSYFSNSCLGLFGEAWYLEMGGYGQGQHFTLCSIDQKLFAQILGK